MPYRTALWSQFGAAIDMLDNAIVACPEEVWGDREQRPEYWYLVFHTLFFLDYYLSESDQGFMPPAPFTLAELDPAGVMPERVYSRAELRSYLRHGRGKCRSALERLTHENAREACRFERKSMSVWELLLYNLRHVQHHTAQLNLILRQRIDFAPGWLSQAPDPLPERDEDPPQSKIA